MNIDDLKRFARDKQITLRSQEDIAAQAVELVITQHAYTTDEIKAHYDQLLDEIEQEAYRVYLDEEKQYGATVFKAFIEATLAKDTIRTDEVSHLLGEYFPVFDKFFLSLAQGRKARAGQTSEGIHRSLFRRLSYPFTEQPNIDGRPDFVLPSVAHYQNYAIDCIIFTSKRTLRERWRQVVTEGTRGLGFYLATLDAKITLNQLNEMRHHRIHIVCPNRVKQSKYPDVVNALSFQQFFQDHLDPAMERWKRNGVITDV